MAIKPSSTCGPPIYSIVFDTGFGTKIRTPMMKDFEIRMKHI